MDPVQTQLTNAMTPSPVKSRERVGERVFALPRHGLCTHLHGRNRERVQTQSAVIFSTTSPKGRINIWNASRKLSPHPLPWSKGRGYQTRLALLSVPSPFVCKREGRVWVAECFTPRIFSL